MEPALGDEVSQFRMSGFDSSDRWLELVRAIVRVRLVPVRVPRSDCPGYCPAHNPDTRGTLGGPASGSSPWSGLLPITPRDEQVASLERFRLKREEAAS